jgi:hypothetical protein
MQETPPPLQAPIWEGQCLPARVWASRLSANRTDSSPWRAGDGAAAISNFSSFIPKYLPAGMVFIALGKMICRARACRN